MLKANEYPLFDNLCYNLRPGAFAIVSILVERLVIRFEKKMVVWKFSILLNAQLHIITKLLSFTISIQKISRQKQNCILTCINFGIWIFSLWGVNLCIETKMTTKEPWKRRILKP